MLVYRKSAKTTANSELAERKAKWLIEFAGIFAQMYSTRTNVRTAINFEKRTQQLEFTFRNRSLTMSQGVPLQQRYGESIYQLPLALALQAVKFCLAFLNRLLSVNRWYILFLKSHGSRVKTVVKSGALSTAAQESLQEGKIPASVRNVYFYLILRFFYWIRDSFIFWSVVFTFQKWQKRWFVLNSSGILEYYVSDEQRVSLLKRFA